MHHLPQQCPLGTDLGGKNDRDGAEFAKGAHSNRLKVLFDLKWKMYYGFDFSRNQAIRVTEVTEIRH